MGQNVGRLAVVSVPASRCSACAASLQACGTLLLRRAQGAAWNVGHCAAGLIARSDVPPFLVVAIDSAGPMRSFNLLPYKPGGCGACMFCACLPACAPACGMYARRLACCPALPRPACPRCSSAAPGAAGTGMGGFRGDAERWPGGGCEAYMRRVVHELMPLVHDTFATTTDPARVAFGGGSFAGKPPSARPTSSACRLAILACSRLALGLARPQAACMHMSNCTLAQGSKPATPPAALRRHHLAVRRAALPARVWCGAGGEPLPLDRGGPVPAGPLGPQGRAAGAGVHGLWHPGVLGHPRP